MPIAPLGIGSYKRSDGFVPEVVLRNMYLEEDKSGISPDKTLRIQRPGMVLVFSYPDPIRGVHYRTSASEYLLISGQKLYSGPAERGSLPGAGNVAITSTQFSTVIVSGGRAYIYATDVKQLTLPADSPSKGAAQDVDQLNNYHLILQPNGRFYWLEPDQTEINPLNFATAESLPDAGIALRRLGDEFWIFGAENVEVWQPTGDQDLPFARAAGRNFERGCLYRDTVRRFDNTLVWVGDDYQVYRAANVPQVISDSGISERIRRAGGECSAWTLSLDGHSFYVLRIPGEGTFAFDASTKAWSEFASLGRNMWLPAYGIQISGVPYAGCSEDGRFWRIYADAANDAGEAIECVVTATVPIQGKPQRNDSVSVGVGATQDFDLRMRWKEGQDDYPSYYDTIDVRAPYDIATLYRLGSPDQPYRTLEVSKVDPNVRLRIAGCVFNEAWD